MTKYALVGVACFVLIGLFTAVKFPLLFKYADTLESIEKSEMSEFTGKAFTVTIEDTQQLDKLVADIPFVSQNRQVFTVSYQDKFRRTVVEGDGNCSNHITAISWYFLSKLKTKSFNIVHFLPRESFIKGFGHTVIDFGGIYDVFEGGAWYDTAGNKVSLQEVLTVNPQVAMKQFTMKSLNPSKEEKSESYVGELIDINFIGITPAESFQEYIAFINLAYIPFSNKKFEKYFYDAVALFFGKLPTVYTFANLDGIYGQYETAISLARLWLFIVRILPLLFVLFVVWKIYLTLTNGKNK